MMIAVTSEEDHTVETCPCCGSDKVDVRTQTKEVVDIPEPVIATKKSIRYSKGRCSKGHNIDTAPKGLTKGSSFGPGIMTYIVYMFFTTLSMFDCKGSADVWHHRGRQGHCTACAKQSHPKSLPLTHNTSQTNL